MSEINNIDIYTERMKKTALDKCWWVSLIWDSNIHFIIDIGCGDGEIFKIINTIFPNKYFYFGIENNKEMAERARENLKDLPAVICEDIDELLGRNIDGDCSVVVMNSVLHEIYSYMFPVERCRFMEKVNKLNAKFITVRDMHKPLLTPSSVEKEMAEMAILNSKYRDAYNDYINRAPTYTSGQRNYLEFLLKYLYTENWERERDEFYFWNWRVDLCGSFGIFKNYDVIYESDFSIPYLVNKVKEDFGTDLFDRFNTHKKMLLVKREENI